MVILEKLIMFVLVFSVLGIFDFIMKKKEYRDKVNNYILGCSLFGLAITIIWVFITKFN